MELHDRWVNDSLSYFVNYLIIGSVYIWECRPAVRKNYMVPIVEIQYLLLHRKYHSIPQNELTNPFSSWT